MEKTYTEKMHIAKMKRLISALEADKPFAIQIKGKKIRVPKDARVSIEYEKDGKNNELEFQVKW